MPNPTKLRTWAELKRHTHDMKRATLRELFRRDPGRFERFSLKLDDLLFDYSKQLITEKTVRLLLRLAKEARVKECVESMFAGERINVTEGRAALHVALRHLGKGRILIDGKDVMPAVRAVREKMGEFAERVRGGHFRGATGKPLRHIVNIGIGGSDLGPHLAAEALRPFWGPELDGYFVSNVDGAHLAQVIERLDAERTLFIVSSKTFTTQETLANARSARVWLAAKMGREAVKNHFVAVSTNAQEVAAFGIDPANMFEFWDWVGGRFSVWSAIGLSLEILIGRENFEKFLAGAESADRHFRSEPSDRNIPIMMGLLGVWNTNFLGCGSHAVLPYDQRLRLFPAWLQQGEMESNGKGTDRDGRVVRGYHTCPVVWGEAGTNGQHAFYQLLHQGTRMVPADFIAAAEGHYRLDGADHHRLLLSNFFAQSQALAFGKTAAEVRAELRQKGLDETTLRRQLPHRVFSGNRPTSSILFRRLDPFSLGRLMALYEHKIFVQGVIWNINSFDQWGVELGKQLAGRMLDRLEGKPTDLLPDASTAGLLGHYLFLQSQGRSGQH